MGACEQILAAEGHGADAGEGEEAHSSSERGASDSADDHQVLVCTACSRSCLLLSLLPALALACPCRMPTPGALLAELQLKLKAVDAYAAVTGGPTL